MLTRIVVTGGYATVLLVIPHTVHTLWFLPTLFALRIMLFAPFMVDKFADTGPISDRHCHMSKIRRFNTWCLALFSIFGLCELFFAREQFSAACRPVRTNYAASALTEDMVLGLSSGMILALFSPT